MNKDAKIKKLEKRIEILRYALENKIDESIAELKYNNENKIKKMLNKAIKITHVKVRK